MKHIKTIVIGSAIAVTAGAGAVSAGNPVAAPADPVITQPAPPVLTTDDWTGAYIGSALGYGDYSIGGTSGNGASLGDTPVTTMTSATMSRVRNFSTWAMTSTSVARP